MEKNFYLKEKEPYLTVEDLNTIGYLADKIVVKCTAIEAYAYYKGVPNDIKELLLDATDDIKARANIIASKTEIQVMKDGENSNFKAEVSE